LNNIHVFLILFFKNKITIRWVAILFPKKILLTFALLTYSSKSYNIMPTKKAPTSGEKSKFMLHVVIFILANAGLWLYWYYGQGAKDKWVYPWGIWITAAWGLSLLGHWASLFTNYEDAGVKEYLKQKNN
jgi:hypothetical protein